MSDVATPILRAHLDRIVRGAISAASPSPLVRAALQDGIDGERVNLLALGKAAVPMAAAAYQALGSRIAAGLVVAPAIEPHQWPGDPPSLLEGDHPVPGMRSLAAGEAVLAFLQPLRQDDVLLVLLSGGASALITVPLPGLSLDDLAQTTRLLLSAGADIHELNCVRKHMDAVKGGRLARAAAPAHVLCLTLSDVIGDDPAVIASGPFAPDPTGFTDAAAVLRRHELWSNLPAAVRRHLEHAGDESVKPGDPALERVTTRIIGSNRTATDAAAALCAELGYRVLREERPISGEARIAGAEIAERLRQLPAGSALVLGGETTVTVRGGGTGGRNQELALAAALRLEGTAGWGLAAAGTDGVDGTSPAAGGIVDGTTCQRLRALGIDPGRALDLNDSYPALAAVDDALVTGPTGTNVVDLIVALRAV